MYGRIATMSRLRRCLGPALVVAVTSSVALAACGSSDRGSAPKEDAATQPAGAAEGRLTTEGAARCARAMLGSGARPPAGEATVASSFALIGPGRDFHGFAIRRRQNGLLTAKIPAMVEGAEPVTVMVPDHLTDKVGLDYGDFNEAKSIREAATSIRFEPCAGQRRTTWPGGLILASREPIALTVVLGDGREEVIRIGRS